MIPRADTWRCPRLGVQSQKYGSADPPPRILPTKSCLTFRPLLGPLVCPCSRRIYLRLCCPPGRGLLLRRGTLFPAIAARGEVSQMGGKPLPTPHSPLDIR
jgi:hypothetical protein